MSKIIGKGDPVPHTPGPWHLLDGEALEAEGFTTIAETARHAIRGRYAPSKVEANHAAAYALDEANARLIAAAPDLLEAATAILNSCLSKKVSNQADFERAVGLLNRAYAKAVVGNG